MNTVISVRVDKSIKESAQEIANSVGLKLSTIINAYLRQVVATRQITFYAPEQMSPKLEKLIADVEKELQSKSVSQKFHNVDDFLSELKK